MKKQGGFTLIELVVVIVILGILAVTAAPKFLNLQSDARASSLQGLKGAMAGAAGISYGKAAIEGQETLPSVTAASSATGFDLTYGYPAATSTGIGSAVEGLGSNDGDWVVIDTDTNEITYSFVGTDSGSNCVVTYKTNASSGAPTITSPKADAC